MIVGQEVAGSFYADSTSARIISVVFCLASYLCPHKKPVRRDMVITNLRLNWLNDNRNDSVLDIF